MKCRSCAAVNPPGSQFCGECGGKEFEADAPAARPATQPPQPRPPAAITVGSAPDCDIRVEDPTVSGHHLLVSPAGSNRFKIEDLGSSNGTWVAGQRVRTAEVSSSDVIQLGLRPVEVASLVAALGGSDDGVPDRTLVVGRESPADLLLPYPMVSGRHMEVRAQGPSLVVRDLGSTNGTFVDGKPVQGWTTVPRGVPLLVGSFRVPAGVQDRWLAALRSDSDTGASESRSVTIPETGTIVIGRDPEADITIDAAQVSWHHAQVTSKGGKWIIKDLGSSNGTFLNGSRIRTAQLHPDDELSLGSIALQLSEGRVVAPRRYEGEVRLDAVDLVRVVGDGICILDRVSVSIYPGELVALMGPSGAGKTTLLELLTGQRRPTKGTVLFNGQDLHDNVAGFRDRIGYVPQEDVMHRDLTVFEVLYHAAVMRLPGDLPRSAVVEHVDRLITRMGLAHVRESLIGGETRRGISGGQRKRVNIALELITEPPLLFLDEPTSGLDSTSTLEVLQVLRSLADSGKTIIMTIHQPRVEAFRLVDSLVLLAKGGKLAWFGPADPEPREHFTEHSKLQPPEGGNPADYVIDVLDPPDSTLHRAPQEWKSAYLDSPAYQQFVVQRQGNPSDVTIQPASEGGRPRSGALSQYLNLLARYVRRKWRDKASLAIQMAQAPIVAILLGWLFFDSQLEVVPTFDGELAPVGGVYPTLFLLAASAFWFGCSNVARELVSDRPVFRRERMAGLGVLPYLGSIYTVQLALAAVQVVVMVCLAWLLVGLDFMSFIPACILLLLTAAAGIGLGLLVSSMAPTEVTAIAIIPVILLPQLMLAGFLKLFKDMGFLEQAVTHLVPMRWAFESLAWMEHAVTDFEHDMDDVLGFWMLDGLQDVHVLLDAGVLFGFTGFFLVLTYLRLLFTRTSS